MNILRLNGLKPEPLLNYLAAAGTARLVAEQADPKLRSRWHEGVIEFQTELSEEDIVEFFMEKWLPTPVVTPWNSDTGLRPPELEQRNNEQLVAHTLQLDEPRLNQYSSALEQGKAIVHEAMTRGWINESGALDKRHKPDLLELCRAKFDDTTLHWIDAAAVLTDEKPQYPILLGTGGNLGRLELAPNHLDRVLTVLGHSRARRQPDEQLRRQWLRSALFDDGNPPLISTPVAQFDPGGAGGSASSAFDEGTSKANPWSYILAIEGALLFSSAVARRMSSSTTTAAIPFTVYPTPAGYSSASETEGLKSEFWAPLWSKWLGASALTQLVREGRAEWNSSQARTGRDLALAAVTSGVDQRIGEFVRYVFAERFGQMQLAIPVGRVVPRQSAEAEILLELEEFLSRTRRISNPTSMGTSLRQIEAAQFRFVTARSDSEKTNALQNVLGAAARTEQLAARNQDSRAKLGAPLQLDASTWVPRLDDQSAEFQIAMALASTRDKYESSGPDRYLRRGHSIASILRPIEAGKYGLTFADDGPAVQGLGRRHLVDVLAEVVCYRAIAVEGRQPDPEAVDDVISTGVTVAFDYAYPASVEALAAFVQGKLDETRIGDLLQGLLLLQMKNGWRQFGDARHKAEEWPPHLGISPALADPSWWSIAPFASGRALPRPSTELERTRKDWLPMPPTWPAKLAANNTEQVAREARRRLRVAGYSVDQSFDNLVVSTIDGRHIAASLLVQTTLGGYRELLDLACPTPHDFNTKEDNNVE